jgi:hypothetical protein
MYAGSREFFCIVCANISQVRSYRVRIAANSQNIRTNSQSRQNDFPHISLFLRIFGSQFPSFGNANIWFASVEPTGILVRKILYQIIHRNMYVDYYQDTVLVIYSSPGTSTSRQ